jgi:hypothetical protein
MVIFVSAIVIAALLAIVWVVVDMTRKLMRWAARDETLHERDRTTASDDPGVMPFGGLPPLGPVGPLGGLSPGADIDSTATDEHDLYGE